MILALPSRLPDAQLHLRIPSIPDRPNLSLSGHDLSKASQSDTIPDVISPYIHEGRILDGFVFGKAVLPILKSKSRGIAAQPSGRCPNLRGSFVIPV